MAKGFNWNKVKQQRQVRQQGDLHWRDTEKRPEVFVIDIAGKRWDKPFTSRTAASKAAATIAKRYNKSTRVIKVT